MHHVGLKVILWGGLAAKLAGVKGVVNAVSGLGVMFSLEKESRIDMQFDIEVFSVSRTIERI